MKKRLPIILLLVICMFSTQILATSNKNISIPLPETTIGYLKDDLGILTPVEGHLVPTQMAYSSTEKSATYKFMLYNTNASNTLTAEETDGSLSVTVFLTINYLTRNNGAVEYLLTTVSGHWDILDPYVSVTSTEIAAACTSGFPTLIEQEKFWSVSNNFSCSTGFNQYILNLGWCALGGNLRMQLAMGSTRTWEFFMANMVF